MTPLYLGKSQAEILEMIRLFDELEPLLSTKEFELMLARGKHRKATERMVAARNEMNKYNLRIAQLEGENK